jgi:hypothetical protein
MALKALAWAVVPAVGLAELLGHFFFSSRPPALEDWQKLRPVVAELRKQGELVVVAPRWAEPNARSAFGDALMPLEDVARADETARARAIEVSILGAPSPELEGWKLESERREGKFRLRTLSNPKPARVVFDFLEHVADAAVVTQRGATETPCPWNPRAHRDAGGLHGNPAFPSMRHECGQGEEHFVGVTVVEDQEWRGRRCLWAEPTPGATRVVRFHDVPLGSVIRGYATLPWWIERELRGGDIELSAWVGGESVGTYVHADGDGWKPFEFALGAKKGTIGDVEFRIKGSRGRDRQFCFQADTR